MDDIIHPAEEFNKLDWFKLAIGPVGKGNWTLSSHRDINHPEQCWTIKVFTDTAKNSFDGLQVDVWILPPALQAILALMEKTGADAVKRKFNAAFSAMLVLSEIQLAD